IAPNTAIDAKTSVEVRNWLTSTRVRAATKGRGAIAPWSRSSTRCTAIGTRKMSSRFTCRPTCATSYVEKPKTQPPTNDGHHRPVMWRHNRYAVVAAEGAASRASVLYEAMGPAVIVTGARTRLGPGAPVAQARLYPAGAHTARVHIGFSPWRMAWGHHAMAQMKNRGSGWPEGPTYR